MPTYLLTGYCIPRVSNNPFAAYAAGYKPSTMSTDDKENKVEEAVAPIVTKNATQSSPDNGGGSVPRLLMKKNRRDALVGGLDKNGTRRNKICIMKKEWAARRSTQLAATRQTDPLAFVDPIATNVILILPSLLCQSPLCLGVTFYACPSPHPPLLRH